MTTPGFTAEASLNDVRSRHRLVSSVQVVAIGTVELAQSGRSIIQPRTANVPLAKATIRPDSYGKHCGIGRGSSDPPIDAVDEVCCRHDKCYCERGYFDCSCDRDLIVDMPAAISQPGVSLEGRAKGALIATSLGADPFCLCHRICRPGFPDFWNVECTDAGNFAVPGIPPLKLCTPPFA